jgi:hypothetical protein
MIGNIEAMIDRWRIRDDLKILDAYFAPKGNRISNKVRVQRLRDAFVEKGINVSHDVFDDYLAIKYLRNSIVHANWNNDSGKLKQDEITWITTRNFPADTRNLGEEDWNRFEWVHKNMMHYIGLTGILNSRLRPKLQVIGIPERTLPHFAGIISRPEWPLLHWSNLNRISTDLEQRIEAASIASEYSWAKGLTDDEIRGMTTNSRKHRRYMAAKTAADRGYEQLASLDNYANDVVFSWTEYTRLIPEFSDLSLSAVHDAFELFRSIYSQKNGSQNEIISKSIKGAYRIGEKAKRAINSIMPLKVFSIQLPIIAPAHGKEWGKKASYIADVCEVGQLWYSSVEGLASELKTIEFCRDMSRALNNSC